MDPYLLRGEKNLLAAKIKVSFKKRGIARDQRGVSFAVVSFSSIAFAVAGPSKSFLLGHGHKSSSTNPWRNSRPTYPESSIEELLQSLGEASACSADHMMMTSFNVVVREPTLCSLPDSFPYRMKNKDSVLVFQLCSFSLFMFYPSESACLVVCY